MKKKCKCLDCGARVNSKQKHTKRTGHTAYDCTEEESK